MEYLQGTTSIIKGALKTFGEEGWELVAVKDVWHYFKREKVETIEEFEAD